MAVFRNGICGLVLPFTAGALCGQVVPVQTTSLVSEAYIKASNTRGQTGLGQQFGRSVAMSGDTLVVGANGESSNATGVNGDQRNILAPGSGAAYVFVRIGGVWTQQAYLKPSNTRPAMYFGTSVAISGDTIVVGANEESSNARGVNGNQNDQSVHGAGAAYVFVRNGGTWSQQAYLKASDTPTVPRPLGLGPFFGYSVAISGDTIAVGASMGGAVYLFVRNGTSWTQQAHLSGSGSSVALSGDTLVIAQQDDSSDAIGVNGDPKPGTAVSSGAAYVFVRNGTSWTQQAYLKASNARARDRFGWSAAISGDTILVGAPGESSKATGVNGDQTDRSVTEAGAVYVFVRTGTSWKQEAYLKPRVAARNFFGAGVAVDGERVIVTAPQYVDQLFLFERRGATWISAATISPRPLSFPVIRGDTVVAADYNDDSNATGVNGNPANTGAINSGAVLLYTIRGGSPPAVSDQAESVIPGVPKTFALRVNAPANGTLTFSTLTGPASGTVALDTGKRQATYTPGVNFTAGSDSFSFQAIDSSGLTATATVRLELLDERRTQAKLIAISSALDGGQCAPESLLRIDATWLNAGAGAPTVVAKELIDTGGTLEETSFEPPEGEWEAGSQFTGHFAIRLKECAAFHFRIGLFLGAADADADIVSPDRYLGGLGFDANFGPEIRTSPIGYELSIGPGGSGNDTPRFVLTNKSDSLEITRLVFAVGDTRRNFDIGTFVGGSSSAGVRATIVTPDAGNGGLRSDSLEVTFTGLTPGRFVSIATDVDVDDVDTVEDFTKVFFNNGELPNATVRVEFSDGSVLTQTLPDGSAPGNSFVFSQSDP